MKKHVNKLTEEQVAALVEDFHAHLFNHQGGWWKNRNRPVRNITKYRQSGATWYFIREAFIDVITTGDNNIFLSASPDLSRNARECLGQWVKSVTGVVLKGTPITMWNGATLYFSRPDIASAHIYFDEYAWMRLFQVADVQENIRVTYFTSPGPNHNAYAFWSGAAWNNVSHAALRHGMEGLDGQWRQMVTIEDAAAGGCDLFDIEALRRDYSDDDFNKYFLCHWPEPAR